MNLSGSFRVILGCSLLSLFSITAQSQVESNPELIKFIEIAELRDAEKATDLIVACGEFVAAHPKSAAIPLVRFYQGKAAFDLKKYETAIEATSAIIANPGEFSKLTETHMLRGEAHRMKEDWPAALPDFEIAYDGFINSKNAEAPHALYHIIQGQLDAGNKDSAKESYDALVEGFPDSKYVATSAKLVGATPPATTKPAVAAKAAAFSPGDEAPEISFFQLDDNAEKSLADLKGKVVVLDFWASWCGPCQKPMAKMQTYAEEHPEWGDKVKLVALSIDNKAETAVAHLAKNGWDKTYNVWAGEGGFKAGAPVAYKVRGIPTACVIDQDGKIAAYGHPASMDLSTIVGDLLK